MKSGFSKKRPIIKEVDKLFCFDPYYEEQTKEEFLEKSISDLKKISETLGNELISKEINELIKLKSD